MSLGPRGGGGLSPSSRAVVSKSEDAKQSQLQWSGLGPDFCKSFIAREFWGPQHVREPLVRRAVLLLFPRWVLVQCRAPPKTAASLWRPLRDLRTALGLCPLTPCRPVCPSHTSLFQRCSALADCSGLLPGRPSPAGVCCLGHTASPPLSHPVTPHSHPGPARPSSRLRTPRRCFVLGMLQERTLRW